MAENSETEVGTLLSPTHAVWLTGDVWEVQADTRRWEAPGDWIKISSQSRRCGDEVKWSEEQGFHLLQRNRFILIQHTCVCQVCVVWPLKGGE